MSHGSGSRERMIEATISLLRGSGFTGAGINEIVRASAAPKGSVYHHFPGGKLQIAGEALAVYTRRVMTFIDQALSARRRPGDKLKSLFDALATRIEESDFRKSCAVGTVSLDLDEDLEALRGILAAALADWTALIASHFDLGDARRTRSFAGLVLTTIEGAYVRSRAERTSRPFREAGAWLAEIAAAPPRAA
ncbi:MAG TPA: TetR family transcriptional regulator C-terminal domain-containing protein [Casimicrobiaceae bacterium]|nr:TetR family transcriptional regulator C-terminal domain-containing protein [Casimicrobiaceae bacterium]